MWVWCQQAICSMPSVQQQKTLVLKRPVLFAEQINPVSLPSVVLHDQGCRRQKLPVQSNTMVLDRWWHGAPKYRVWNLFALKLAANAVRTEPVTRGHVVSSPWPIEQQRWELFEVELTLRPASEPAQSYNNPALKWQRRIPISQSRLVQDCVVSSADDEDGKNRTGQLEPHASSSTDEHQK